MSFTMGYTPQDFVVILAQGADFATVLRRTDGTPWPAGLAVSIDFSTGQSWGAQVDGELISWTIDAAQVDEVIAANPASVRLWYVDGATRLMWGAGKVSVRA
jgi:hypothetical protein